MSWRSRRLISRRPVDRSSNDSWGSGSGDTWRSCAVALVSCPGCMRSSVPQPKICRRVPFSATFLVRRSGRAMASLSLFYCPPLYAFVRVGLRARSKVTQNPIKNRPLSRFEQQRENQIGTIGFRRPFRIHQFQLCSVLLERHMKMSPKHLLIESLSVWGLAFYL